MLDLYTAPAVDITPILDALNNSKGFPLVDLSGLKITPDQLDLIASTASYYGYNSYKMSNCGLTPAHISKLPLKGINTLIVDNNPTLTANNADGIERIAKLNVPVLNLSYCNAGIRISALKNTNLQSLTCRGGTATGVNMAGIRDLMAMPSLRSLNLSGNWLNFDNAGCLVVGNNAGKMEFINLRGCNAMDDAVRLISLSRNCTGLDLSNCRSITPVGMGYLANMQLTNLTLIGMPISTAPAAQKNLRIVDLNFNTALGDAGLKRYIDTCPDIRSISLFSCGLTDAGASLILTNWPNLVRINIDENAISSSMRVAIQERIKANINRAGGLAAVNAFGLTRPAVLENDDSDIEEIDEPAPARRPDPLDGKNCIAEDSELARTEPEVILSNMTSSFWNRHKELIVERAKTMATYDPQIHNPS